MCISLPELQAERFLWSTHFLIKGTENSKHVPLCCSLLEERSQSFSVISTNSVVFKPKQKQQQIEVSSTQNKISPRLNTLKQNFLLFSYPSHPFIDGIKVLTFTSFSGLEQRHTSSHWYFTVSSSFASTTFLSIYPEYSLHKQKELFSEEVIKITSQ